MVQQLHLYDDGDENRGERSNVKIRLRVDFVIEIVIVFHFCNIFIKMILTSLYYCLGNHIVLRCNILVCSLICKYYNMIIQENIGHWR